MLIRVCVLASLACAVAFAASSDTDMARALDNSINTDSLVITIKQIHPRKRQKMETETLLSISTPTSDAWFSVKLDRGNKKLVFDSQKEKKHLDIETLADNRMIHSLVLVLDQRKPTTEIQVYLDCILEGTLHLDINLLHLFKKDHKFIVLRERRYVMELDSDTGVQEVLKRLKCDLHDQMLAQNAGEDDEEEDNIRARDPSRGDIPIFHDCDDNLLVKTINKLIGVVNRLQDELEAQRTETSNLRQLLEQCDICKPGEGY